MLNEMFDMIVYINRQDRPDRLGQMEAELRKHNVCAHRVEAVVDDNATSVRHREAACHASHLKAWEYAFSFGGSSALIMEDDVYFADDMSIRLDALQQQEELHDLQWHMIYLGGNDVRPAKKFAPGLKRIRTTWAMHAYGITAEYAEWITKRIKRREPIDVEVANFHGTNFCYGLDPYVAFQRKGWSDIQGKEVDYSKYLNR